MTATTAPASPAPPSPGLRFGFSSLGCPELDPEGLRALAATHRSRFVEIRTLGDSLDFVATLARYPGGAAAVRDFFLEADVRVRLVGSSFQLARATEDQRAGLVAEAEAGEALGARWLRVFGGGTWGDPFTPEQAATARAHRDWWRALRAARGWTIDLIIELHDAFSGSPQILALCDQTGGPMPVLWDTHASWRTGGESLAETWALLGPQVRHAHVNDSVSRRMDANHDHTLVTPGTGEFPLTELFSLLAENRFDGVVSLEWEKKWIPSLAPLATVLPAWNEVIAPFRQTPRATTAEPTLLLKCDFDRASVVPATGPYFHGGREQYEDIHSNGPTSCPAGLGEPTPDHPRLGKLRLYYEGGDASQRSARIVPDDADPQNRVLRFRLTEPNVTIQWPDSVQHKARVQAEVYGNVEWRDFYQTVRLRLSPEAAKLRDYPGKIEWFTLMEFWNNAGWTDEPFIYRFGFHLAKPDPAPGTDLYFATGSQCQTSKSSFEDVWHRVNMEVPVPFGQWMTVEVFFQEGNEETGRFHAAVTPDGGQRTVLFDVRGWTHHPENPTPSGLKQACPLKLYTSDAIVDYMKAQGSALEVDWDDLEIWRGRTPAEG